MSDEWIDKLFRDKETQEKLHQQTDATLLKNRRLFLDHADSLQKWLSKILIKAIEGFNKRQRDPKGKIEYNIPPGGVIQAHKASHPSGNLLVGLNLETQRIVCTSLLSRAPHESLTGPTVVEYAASVSLEGDFYLYENRNPIPTDLIAEKILREYFKAII
jgi:hypothetical protein